MHPNEDTARKAYVAFAEGDMATLSALMADDLTWNVPGDNSISGTYRGKEEVFGFLGTVAGETGGSMALDIHDVLANDDHAVALVRNTASRGGDVLDQRFVHVMHLADGAITEFWAFAEDQAAVDQFWG